jgi:hypothetical protein
MTDDFSCVVVMAEAFWHYFKLLTFLQNNTTSTTTHSPHYHTHKLLSQMVLLSDRAPIRVSPGGIGPVIELNENDVLCGRGGRWVDNLVVVGLVSQNSHSLSMMVATYHFSELMDTLVTFYFGNSAVNGETNTWEREPRRAKKLALPPQSSSEFVAWTHQVGS